MVEKSRLLIAGIALLGFGLANFFRYMPVSLSLVNRPFPFEHLKNVMPSEHGGTGIQIGYVPIHEASSDPYWLVWSLAFYAGIGVIVFSAWRKR